jgi:hypothetical protein
MCGHKLLAGKALIEVATRGETKTTDVVVTEGVMWQIKATRHEGRLRPKVMKDGRIIILGNKVALERQTAFEKRVAAMGVLGKRRGFLPKRVKIKT